MKNLTAISVLAFLFSLMIFLSRIDAPDVKHFDELHYVPAALQHLDGVWERNLEHPPLGKYLIAKSIHLFGDAPFGWRLPSAIAGAFLVAFVVMLAGLLAPTYFSVTTAFLFMMLGGHTVVQARMAMLDTFMLAFAVGAILLTLLAIRSASPKKCLAGLVGAAVFLGLSLASKWSGLFAWFGCLCWLSATRLGWLKDEKSEGFARCSLGVVLPVVLLVPVLTYFATYLPLLGLQKGPQTLWDAVLLQKKMVEMHSRVPVNHSYASRWWTWPLLLRPIWYHFQKVGPVERFYEGVVLLGNPLLMWGGLVALGLSIYQFIRQRTLIWALPPFFFLLFWLPWSLSSHVSFYYYYFPSAIFLTLSTVFVLDRLYLRAGWFAYGVVAFWSLVIGFGFYYWPLWMAIVMPFSKFRFWIWFRSWI